MEAPVQIRGRTISPSHPPYVIAEVSCNHAGSEAVAHALIKVAKDAGAEAVKFQFYTPEGMVGPKTEVVHPAPGAIGFVQHHHPPIEDGPWAGESMYSLYSRSQMPWEWGPRLKAHCHQEGLAFIASAYDVDGLAWLMKECVPDALKVASFEATDRDFILAMLQAGPPVIVSLGMQTRQEKIKTLLQLGYSEKDVAALHCVSAYPTPPASADLDSLWWVADQFTSEACATGFSDHTLGHAVACAAVAKGACVLEKHIQLHPSLQTADSHFSLTPDQFNAYCSAVNDAWSACQSPVGDVEASSRQFRRAPGGKRGSYSTTPNGIVGVTGTGISG